MPEHKHWRNAPTQDWFSYMCCMLDEVKLPVARNVFIFGAGASQEPQHVRPERPPLGNELFAQLANRYPRTWGALPASLEEEFTTDFESGIQRLLDSSSHAIGPLMQQMALFFAAFVPDGSRQEAYARLFGGLRASHLHSSVLASTLNYECLLEIAIRQAGLQISYNEKRPTAEHVPVWKLHGSCNFQPNPAEITARRGVSFSFDAVFSTEVRAKELHEIRRWLEGDNALYPAMCVYAAHKPSQISPSVIESYWEPWSTLVRRADNVFVVGVRPHPPDRHIWIPLAETQANLYFVGSERAFREWEPRRAGGVVEYITREFGAAIDEIIQRASTQ